MKTRYQLFEEIAQLHPSNLNYYLHTCSVLCSTECLDCKLYSECKREFKNALPHLTPQLSKNFIKKNPELFI